MAAACRPLSFQSCNDDLKFIRPALRVGRIAIQIDGHEQGELVEEIGGDRRRVDVRILVTTADRQAQCDPDEQ